MDEQKKEVSAQAQPETAEPMQTDEINEQIVQIEQAEVEMAADRRQKRPSRRPSLNRQSFRRRRRNCRPWPIKRQACRRNCPRSPSV